MRNFIITVNGKSYEVGVEEVGETSPRVVPVSAPAPTAAKPAPAESLSGTKVLAPFNGDVKNLLVASGTSVKKNQPILVLEAMKMDTDIPAPCDGVVTYAVQKGAKVETDALLAVIN